MKIKICGIRSERDVEYANIARPDYIGYVFAPTRRYVSPEEAAGLTRLLDKDIIPVGVFVDAPAELPIQLAESGVIRAVQLHGSEDEDYILALKSRGIYVIKAFIVRTKEDAACAQRSSADMVLLDSGRGTGQSFEWENIQGISRDYFLAGGMDKEKILSAGKLLHPYAVDTSSAAETDGVKDLAKMRELVEAARTIHDP